ncbi:MAG TPA: mycofactocin biosynthesis glycosyltransferase MftF [Acidimicrobiales bacterium]|nr:mycofactocin biosynthesis glycosyltransferase MftF [Acidimicrobiales bacterium]
MDVAAGAYPSGFRLVLDEDTHRPSPRTLIGGSPVRLVRLSDVGSRLVDSWLSGAPVGPRRAAQMLARRLVDAGIAQPQPPSDAGPGPDEVTVVVPVRDRPSGLAETLAALNGLNVVVVDDASLEPVVLTGREVIRREVIRRELPGGPAAARDTGWRSAASPVVVFLDADCVPGQGWLTRLLAHFADARVGAVAPRVRPAPGGGLLTRYERAVSPLDMGARTAAVGPGTRVPYVPTACLAVRTSALEASGGFDEDLRFGEDVDLVWRLIAAGWSVRYEPRAAVWHPPRAGIPAMIRQRFDYGRSAAPLALRHGSDTAPLAVSVWGAGAWALAAFGRVVPATGLVAVASAVAARRVATDGPSRRAVAALAARGNLATGKWIATAVRRAWVPPLLLMLCCAPRSLRRRAASWLVVSFLWPAVDWLIPPAGTTRPEMGLLAWTALRWMDDLAYQAGVWTGALQQRSARALLPKLRARASARPQGQAAATVSSSASPVSR